MNYLKTIGNALNKDIAISTKQQTIETCEMIDKVAWNMYIKSMDETEWKMWEAIQCLVKTIKANTGK